MNVSSYYPPGPDRLSDAAPLLDAADVAECRRIVGQPRRSLAALAAEVKDCEANPSRRAGCARD